MKSSDTNEMFLNFNQMGAVDRRKMNKPGKITIFALKIHAAD